MFDHMDHARAALSHDLPCFRCGHAAHTYLACSDECACDPESMPGAPPLLATDHHAVRMAA